MFIFEKSMDYDIESALCVACWQFFFFYQQKFNSFTVTVVVADYGLVADLFKVGS